MNKSKLQLMVLLSELFSMMRAGCQCIWNGCQCIWNGLLFLFKRIDSATAVYAGMLRWGRRSGVPAALSETPVEYGGRLSHHFPEFKEPIEMIIDTINLEAYGNVIIEKRLLSRIVSAHHKMRSPRYWLLRLRARFFQHPLQLGSSG
jgi:hypothetical protein